MKKDIAKSDGQQTVSALIRAEGWGRQPLTSAGVTIGTSTQGLYLAGVENPWAGYTGIDQRDDLN